MFVLGPSRRAAKLSLCFILFHHITWSQPEVRDNLHKTLKHSAEEQNIEWKNQGRCERKPCCFLSSLFGLTLTSWGERLVFHLVHAGAAWIRRCCLTPERFCVRPRWLQKTEGFSRARERKKEETSSSSGERVRQKKYCSTSLKFCSG